MSSRLRELLKKKRRHAGFFHWPARPAAERNIVRCFSESAQAQGEPGLSNIDSVRPDPPDCEAIDSHGRRVGVEVTEFVDQALAGQRPITTRPKIWESNEVVTRLAQIIEAKDRKCSDVAGFARLILLIHTDEMFLRGYAGGEILDAVRLAAFERPRHIDEVVFMVSYDARTQTYPFVRLQLSATISGQ